MDIMKLQEILPKKVRAWWPDRKFMAMGLGGVVAWFGFTALETFAGFTLGEDLKVYAATAIGVGINYLTKSSQFDIVRRVDDGIIALAIQSEASEATAEGAIASGMEANRP